MADASDLLRAIESVNAADLTPQTFWEVIHRMRYTGSIVLHFDQGTPTTIELGRPIQVRLARPARRATA